MNEERSKFIKRIGDTATAQPSKNFTLTEGDRCLIEGIIISKAYPIVESLEPGYDRSLFKFDDSFLKDIKKGLEVIEFNGKPMKIEAAKRLATTLVKEIEWLIRHSDTYKHFHEQKQGFSEHFSD
ncbi:MAG: hypothetical protein HON90_15040 [Halobacteriovoraceae bacterium]|jgi:hypothetical protein|nr:hypothetical protein [Halobacteriovoraceae bacterium]